MNADSQFVMPAPVAGIHDLLSGRAFKKDVDGRDGPGHDVERVPIPIEDLVEAANANGG